MPSLTYEYVYFGSGGAHTRQPRVITSYGGFTPIPTLNTGGSATLQTGTPFQVNSAILAPVQIVAGITYSFAFVNVSGLIGGGQTSFDHSVAPPSAIVGTDPVTVLIVYLPQVGGPPGSSSGAIIDAFDETKGTLVDDTFVSVTVNGVGNAVLTTSGNVDGYVDTTNNEVVITAYSNISPTNGNFDKWGYLTSPVLPPAGLNLTVPKGQTVYAFAFYQSNNKSRYTKEFVYEVPPQKVYSGKEKDGKELVDNIGDWNWVVDPPYILGEIQKLNTVIAALEIKIQTAIKGQAFIRKEERPDVGKTSPRG
jgi:hypothetical protein